MKAGNGLTVLLWHVHGSWTDAFVRGPHRYVLPVLPEGGSWGRGRCGRPWPDTVVEREPGELADEPIDVVVLQRPDEISTVERLLGRRPGMHLPAVYVEHNAPTGHAANSRHFLADQRRIPLVHVTEFNDLMWDSGQCPRTVVHHGIPDPGERYTGELARAAVLINEPMRRWRVTGTDLLPRLSAAGPVDVYGIGSPAAGELAKNVHGMGEVGGAVLHTAMARRRVYLHTARWTSLGFSLIEAMHLGMPVLSLATTEAARAVPRDAGVVDTSVATLEDALRGYLVDRELATTAGKHARQFALAHYGLPAFLARWNDILTAAATGGWP